jgi:hypothetical protein
MIVTASFLLKMKIFQTQVVEKIKTHILSSISFSSKIVENHCRAGQAADENYYTAHAFACLLPQAANTYSVCVIFTAFPLQQWLHELASILRTNIA